MRFRTRFNLLYLDEEISHPQTRSPRHAPLIDRFQVLQRGERWCRSKLFYGSLSWKEQKYQEQKFRVKEK